MFEVRKLSTADLSSLLSLISVVEDNLAFKEQWLPMEEKEKEALVTNIRTMMFGMFDGDILIGATGLFWDTAHVAKYLGNIHAMDPVAVVGRGMVLPSYRKQGIASRLLTEIMDMARVMGFNTLVVSAHPENKASIKTLTNAGFTVREEREMMPGYKRSILSKEL